VPVTDNALLPGKDLCNGMRRLLGWMVGVSELWYDVVITQSVENVDDDEYVAFRLLLLTGVSESDRKTVLSSDAGVCS